MTNDPSPTGGGLTVRFALVGLALAGVEEWAVAGAVVGEETVASAVVCAALFFGEFTAELIALRRIKTPTTDAAMMKPRR